MNIQKWVDAFMAWLIHEGPKIIVAIIIFLVGQWLIQFLKKWYKSWSVSKKLDSSLRPFLSGVIFTILQLLLLLAVMQILGIQMTIFAALIGAVGIAAGLALSGTLQNFTSGILILLLKPYQVGDLIMAQGVEGKVTAIQIFFTTITSYDNKIIIIPNSKLSNELITNMSREDKRRVDMTLKFPFTTDYVQLQKTIADTFPKNGEFIINPEPATDISAIESDGYTVVIKIWVNADHFADSKSSLLLRLLNAIRKGGLGFAGT